MFLKSLCYRPKEAENKNNHCVSVNDYQPTASGDGEVTQERYRMSTMNGKQSGCAIKLAFWGSGGHLSLSAPNPLTRTARPWVCHCALNLKWDRCQLKTSHHCLLEGQTVTNSGQVWRKKYDAEDSMSFWLSFFFEEGKHKVLIFPVVKDYEDIYETIHTVCEV